MILLNDIRVYYVELVKWVVVLWYVKIDGNFVLLKIQMYVGYGGISGCYECWKEIVF